MPRKRNRKRQTRSNQLRLPTIPWSRLVAFGASLVIIAAVYVATIWLLDRPIDAVVINGAFERVSAMQLEEQLAPLTATGFLSADLGAMQRQLAALPWVASATVRRRWPGTIEMAIAEEEAAACWRERGLLNTDGRLFIADASHVPAELPRLAGPDGSEARVAERYRGIEKRLEERGLTAVTMNLDQRGAWDFQLNNGIVVRLGARSVEQRIERFFRALDQVIAAQADQVDYVDLRYTNGFAIGWKAGVSGPGGSEEGMAAGV